jgi:hypothetical protein
MFDFNKKRSGEGSGSNDSVDTPFHVPRRAAWKGLGAAMAGGAAFGAMDHWAGNQSDAANRFGAELRMNRMRPRFGAPGGGAYQNQSMVSGPPQENTLRAFQPAQVGAGPAAAQPLADPGSSLKLAGPVGPGGYIQSDRSGLLGGPKRIFKPGPMGW